MNVYNLRLLTAGLAALAAFGLAPLKAAVTSWTGADDGVDWTDPGNWSSNSVPTASSTVVIDLQPIVLFNPNGILPTSTLIGIDNFGSGVNAGTITFGPDLTFGVTLKGNVDTMSVGAITNNSNFLQTFTI